MIPTTQALLADLGDAAYRISDALEVARSDLSPLALARLVVELDRILRELDARDRLDATLGQNE